MEKIGIITKGQEANFRTEMAQIREKVDMKLASCEVNNEKISDCFEQVKLEESKNWDKYLKFEIVWWGKDYEQGYSISKVKRNYAKKKASEMLEANAIERDGVKYIPDLYFIDNNTSRY